MDYVRKVDFAAFEASGPGERKSQDLIGHGTGVSTCTIAYIQTPPGGGSVTGRHVHDVDQIFYVLSGTMNIEVEGQEYQCPTGSLIVFPAGVPHRNWNGGSEPTVHLAVNTPLPDPGKPLSRPV